MMKKNWTIKKLGELCDFIGDGDWIESKDQSTKGIRLIQTGNIGNGIYLDKAHHAHFISEETFSRLRCTEIFQGDCLISRLPDPVGRACIIPKVAEKMITAVDCTIIRFNKQIVPKYFVLYAQSIKYFIDIDSESTGATRKRISRKNLEKISVPIPPLEEQKRIVAVLDKKFAQIETLKTAAEKNLQNTKQLFQAELEHEFNNKDWNIVYLEEVSKQMVSGGDAPKDHFSKEKTEKYRIPIYANAVADNGLYGYTDNATINEPSITIAARGSGTGFVSLRNDSFVPIVRLIVIIPNTELVKHEYLYYALRNINIEHNGTAIPQLTLPMIKKYCIPLPPLEEQKRIVAHLDSLSEKVYLLEEIYTKQISDCDELKQSLLAKAFEGNL